MVKSKNLEDDRSRTEHIERVYKNCKKYNNKINSLRMPSCKLNKNSKSIVRNNSKEECLAEINNINMNVKTIYSILQRTFGNNKQDDWSKIGITILSLIYNTRHKIKLLCVFKNENNKNEKILIKSKCGDIDIFGQKYEIIKRKDIIIA